PDPLFARDAGEEGLLHPAAVGLANRNLVAGARTEDAEVFRQQHQLRALAHRIDDERLDRGEIRLDLAAGQRLDRRDAAARAAPRRLPFASAAGPTTLAGWRPLRSTTGSDHPPLTTYSKEKICSIGSCSTFCASSEPAPTAAPMIGLASSRTAAPTDTPAESEGCTRTLSCCVSLAMSASPAIETRADGPTIRRLSLCITPFWMRTSPVSSSKAKPWPNRSRKSNESRRCSACSDSTPRSLPTPGSSFVNWPALESMRNAPDSVG